MKTVIIRKEENGIRYQCPYCLHTLFISDGTTEVELPKKCGRCGEDIEEKRGK